MLSTTTILSVLSLPLLASAASLKTGTTYSISPASDPSLCVVPASNDDGARLQVTDCDSSDDIAWTFDGKALSNSATDKCADIVDGAAYSGNHIQVWDCYSWNRNQMFASDGGLIKWAGTDYCLDLTDGKAVSGNILQIWSCYDGNQNQQWTFDEVNEVGDCDDDSTGSDGDDGDDDDEDCDSETTTASSATSATSATSTTASAITASITAPANATAIASDSASANSSSTTLGGELWAGGSKSHSHSASQSASATSTDSWDASTTDSWGSSATSSDSWATASTTDDWASASTSAAWGSESSSVSGHASKSQSGSASSTASASASASASAGSGSSGSSDMSGYLQTSGTKVVDASGNTVVLRGTNLGGWLVWEDWMCGITDNSGSADRFPQTTLENRFGEDQTRALMKVWQDNWLVSSDFDTISSMGFNVVRLPFSYRNFLRSDGTYITDSSGDVDFSRLDWAVAQAKQRGIYVIPTYHIWDGQEEQYSTISEDSTDGQAQRDKAGELWTKIAEHFAGEASIAAFDAINEPTGSANNNLQRDLYNAIRAGDSKRIIIMESISAAPDSDWTNIMYSMHEYLMMGEDNESYNQQMFASGVQSDTDTYTGVGVPTYIGEFMASGDTLTWMLGQLNDMGVWYSGWTYTTTNMDRWGLYNFGGGMAVDVSSDSYDSISSTWSSMGSKSKSRVADAWASGVGGTASKRSVPDEVERTVVYSPRAAEPRVTKRFSPHGGRSRRALAHGRLSLSF